MLCEGSIVYAWLELKRDVRNRRDSLELCMEHGHGERVVYLYSHAPRRYARLSRVASLPGSTIGRRVRQELEALSLADRSSGKTARETGCPTYTRTVDFGRPFWWCQVTPAAVSESFRKLDARTTARNRQARRQTLSSCFRCAMTQTRASRCSARKDPIRRPGLVAADGRACGQTGG